MPRSNSRLLLALSALLALAGCQLTDIEKAICEIGETKCKDGKQLECRANESGKADWIDTDEKCAGTCQEGETKCNDGKQLECRANESGKTDWIKTDENCSSTCQEGETKCIAGNIYTCTADGHWPDAATTECGASGCSEGTIQPANAPLSCFECGSDEARCASNQLLICSNHRLSKTRCDNGCMQTETNAYCRECKDDELKCENGFIISCAKEGNRIGKWDNDTKQSCGENGCFPGARGTADEVKCYECNTDKPKCFRDNESKGTIKKCLAHRWYEDENCEFGCAEGTEAVCKECKEDKYLNNKDGYCVKQTCHGGKIEEGEPAEVSCNKAMNDNGNCLNGSSRCFDKGEDQGAFQYCEDGAWKESGIACDPNNPCALLGNNRCLGITVGQICGEDGKSLVACPKNASCKSDASGCSECQTGTSKCNHTNILECLDGSYVERLCSKGTHCEVVDGKASCVTHECENGAQRCVGDIIQECAHYQWKTKNACSESEQCVDIDGVARCSCTSGVSYCDDTQAIDCRDGKWQTTICNAGIACSVVGGTAKCIECESGTKCQDETKIMTCQNNTWSPATPCTDGMKCIETEGNAKCVCTEGQAKCDLDNTKIIQCTPDGTYGSAESCGADKHCEGVAGSAVCTENTMACSPGAKQCSGDDLLICNAAGIWEKTKPCDLGCSNMACNECKGDEIICKDNDLKKCYDGQWIVSKCLYGCNPNTGECYPKCAPGTQKCDYKDSYRCDEKGMWQMNKCELGCKDGECLDECKSGETQCADKENRMKICINNIWEMIRCPLNSTCDIPSKSCIKCDDKPICLPSDTHIGIYLRIPCKKDVPNYSNIVYCKDETCTACE